MKLKFSHFAIVLIFFMLVYGLSVSGNTIIVTTNQNAGAGSLRQAIADAADGDEIVFNLSAGSETIIITSELAIGKGLTIDGSNSLGSGTDVTVQVTTPKVSAWRVFNINASGKTIVIRNMKIMGGNVWPASPVFALSEYGGAILATAGTLILENLTISDSKGVFGGAVYAETEGITTIRQCTFHDNLGDRGGAVFSRNISLNVTNSTFTGNQATFAGGALCPSGGTLYVINSTITGNNAASMGGGICGHGSETCYLANSILQNNTDTWGGPNFRNLTLYSFFSWVGTGTGTPTYQATAPSINTAYTVGDILPLTDNGGPTQTMKIPSGKPAYQAGGFVYYNATDGYYLKGNDNNYYKLIGYAPFSPTSPETDKMITDQRGEIRQTATNIGAFDNAECLNPTNGGTIAAKQTICYGATPEAFTSEAGASGHSGTLEYQWQSSTVGSSSGFVDIGSATETTYAPGVLTQTTWFKRKSKVTCDGTWPVSGESNVIEITVRPEFTTGAINTTGETICYNGNPSEIGSTTSSSGGDNVISYQWQSSTTSASAGFADIGSATGTTYDPPTGLTATTWYRRMAKDGTCNTTFSASTGVWQVIVRDNFTAGAINTTGETICYNGNPSEIGSTTAASGGDNAISYQWQSSTTSGSADFADIGSATGTTYDPPTGLTATTWYRRMAKDGTCNTTFSASTGVWQVIVRDNFTAGAINTTGETICYNGDPAEIGSATAASGGDNSIQYQWQSVASVSDSPSWTDIPGATNATYNPPSGLTSSTDYRRMAKDGTCNITSTASAGVWTVTVMPEFTSGAIATTGEMICSGSSPSTTIGNVTSGSGGENRIAYSWRSSADSYATEITGATSSTYLPAGPLTETTSYQRYVIDSTCNLTPEASTGTWTVTVDPPTDAGTVTGGTSVCYGTNSTLLTLSGHTGDVTKWQYSTDHTNWSDLTSQTSTTYTAENLTENTWFRAVVQSGVCTEAYSGDTQITVLTGFRISGYAKYENNPKTALNGLKITLKKDGNIFGTPVVTSSTGYYEFAELEHGSYGLDISSAHPSGQWQTWSGVNNTDYLLVARHIAGTQFLPVNPPVVQVSASVKAPHPLINNTDATAIRQAAKYPTTGYSYFDIPKWVFSGTMTTTALDNIEVSCSDVTRDIFGLCAGDVNGTYVPPAGFKTADPGLILVNQGKMPLTDKLLFPIRVYRDMEIGAITLFLDYDPAAIEITGVTMPENMGVEPVFETRNGLLYIGWMSLEPVRLTNGATVLLITGRSLMPDLTPDIRFNLNENPLSEFADAEGIVIEGVKLSMPVAGTDSETMKERNGKMICYPNPARENVNIEIETFNPEAETLVLELRNLQGMTILKTRPETIAAGWYRHQMDVSGIAPGVYFLRANMGSEVLIKKVVITR